MSSLKATLDELWQIVTLPKRTAERYNLWGQVRTLIELAFLVVVLLVAAILLAIFRPAEWLAFAGGLVGVAALMAWLFAYLARVTDACWEEAIRRCQESDQSPIDPAFYNVDSVA